LPRYGWPSMFLVGGLLPLLIVILLQLLLPDGATGHSTSLPGLAPLFRHGWAGKTVAIWVIFIAVLMCVYLLSGWIPLLLNQNGFSSRAAALLGTAYQAGGVVGGIAASLLLARRGWNVVALFAAMACVTLAMLILGLKSTLLLTTGVIAAGFCVTGTQNAINGAAGASYAAGIRSSGLGWALGVGRIGSVAGPLVGSLAVLMGMHEARYLFALPLLPLAVAGVAALWLGRRIAF
jgi:AAHS family 4-hydroxybenzoate transporter-like MFS transporter